MGMTNTQLYALAKSYLGDGGSRFRQFCGLPSNAAWCAAFVSYIFAKGNDANLFYGGKKVVYVPSAQTWCRANLAEIPLYMAMPMDIITFDWNSNGVPDHIGFVKARKSDTEIYTIEGNTSGGIVAEKTRPYKYVSGVWRPQFKPTSFTTLKKLVIDGQFDYNSIACLQLALRRGGYYKGAIDGILGKETVKALQHKASDGSGIKLAQDGAWGMKTTKALQKWLNIEVDGWWGINSTKSLQRWINNYNDWYAKKHNLKPQDDPNPKPDPLQKWYDAMTTQFNWSKNQEYDFDEHPTVENSKIMGTCITFPAVSLQRIGLLPKGEYFYLYPNTMKIAGNGASYVKEHPEKYILWYPNKTIREMGDLIHKGDIVGYGEPAYHTMVYMGKNSKGEPLFNSMGHTKILNGTYSYYANRKINMLVRIKKVK